MKKIAEIWKSLGKPIYVGERLQYNLLILTVISIVTAVLGVILIFINISTHQIALLIASIVTFVAGVSCAIFAGVLKNRKVAAVIPVAFCIIASRYTPRRVREKAQQYSGRFCSRSGYHILSASDTD